MATATVPKQLPHVLTWHQPAAVAPASFGGSRSYAKAKQAAQPYQVTLCGGAKRPGDLPADQAATVPAFRLCSICAGKMRRSGMSDLERSRFVELAAFAEYNRQRLADMAADLISKGHGDEVVALWKRHAPRSWPAPAASTDGHAEVRRD
jgi:hypothetical protein